MQDDREQAHDTGAVEHDGPQYRAENESAAIRCRKPAGHARTPSRLRAPTQRVRAGRFGPAALRTAVDLRQSASFTNIHRGDKIESEALRRDADNKNLASKLFELGSSTERIAAMEGLRAYAVLLTFIVHFFGSWLVFVRRVDVNAISPLDASRTTDKILVWLHLSPYGVYLFFILSGFLICRLVVQQRTFSYRRYLLRRSLRIYPAVLLALLLAAIVLSRDGITGFLTLPNILGNVVFLNAIPQFHVTPILHPTWSLFYEVVFYIVFPVVLALRWLGPEALWRNPACMIVAGLVLVYTPFLLGWGQALFLLFFAGATAARFDDGQLRAFAARLPDTLVAACYVGVTSAITFRIVSDHVAIWLYAIAGTLLTIQACFGSGWLNAFFSLTPLRRFGNVSYSFFLVHVIVIHLVIAHAVPWTVRSTGLIPAVLVGIATAGLSFLLAVIVFAVAERPYFSRRPAAGHPR
jgi:peptidoglycan/LPS O-acetylase OafA/YrhL